MTQEQKPESAEFRTLETQVSECACNLRTSLIALEEKLYVEFAEAEDRGAAEQRRKDAEGAEPVGWVHPQQLNGLLAQSDDPDRDRFIVMTKVRIGSRDVPLYTRPANVAALEAREKELEGAITALFDGQAQLENHGFQELPLRAIIYDDELVASGKDPVEVAMRAAKVIAAAIREGGEG